MTNGQVQSVKHFSEPAENMKKFLRSCVLAFSFLAASAAFDAPVLAQCGAEGLEKCGNAEIKFGFG
jgi:hypothetical protein